MYHLEYCIIDSKATLANYWRLLNLSSLFSDVFFTIQFNSSFKSYSHFWFTLCMVQNLLLYSLFYIFLNNSDTYVSYSMLLLICAVERGGRDLQTLTRSLEKLIQDEKSSSFSESGIVKSLFACYRYVNWSSFLSENCLVGWSVLVVWFCSLSSLIFICLCKYSLFLFCSTYKASQCVHMLT